MSSSAELAPAYDCVDAASLAATLGVPRVALYDSVSSTLDVAHAMAADGAPAGTLVLADEQRAGRGRHGRVWRSEPGQGIWLTLIERPDVDGPDAAPDVLALRLGLHAADALDAFAETPVGLKWPNDLYVGNGKLAGILVEARWRNGRPDWLAVGMGVNVRGARDSTFESAALRDGTSRLDVLNALVPALRAAAQTMGPLTPDELRRWAARDIAVGRRCTEPAAGTVRGIGADGALLIETNSGIAHFRAGSLILMSS